MDEGSERPGLFAKGGVGRFVLALAIGAIVVVALVCGLGTVITGAVVAQGGKHYLENHDEELEGATNEGIAFAAGHTITECVNEAQRRAASCTSLMSMCAMPIGMFAACSKSTEEPAGGGTTPGTETPGDPNAPGGPGTPGGPGGKADELNPARDPDRRP